VSSDVLFTLMGPFPHKLASRSRYFCNITAVVVAQVSFKISTAVFTYTHPQNIIKTTNHFSGM
jgi:hypothetical protein